MKTIYLFLLAALIVASHVEDYRLTEIEKEWER